MPRKFKIDEVLADINETDRLAYEALLRQPATTIDDLLEWLGERGLQVSRGAVWKHSKNFKDMLDGVRQSAEMARAFAAVAKESGVAGTNDAIIGRFQQLQMEWVFAQLQGGSLTPEDFERFAKSMNQAASAAQRNEDLRKVFDEAAKALQSKVEKRGDGKITDADIAEIRKAVFG